MNKRELLVLAVGVFLTVIAWMTIDLYHVQNEHKLDRQIKAARIPKYNIDANVFDKLDAKTP